MFIAATLGHRFSVIVGRRKWIPKMRDNAILAGLDRRVASFRSVEMGIPEMLEDPQRLEDRVIEEGRRAYEEDGAEVLLLAEMVSPSLAARAHASSRSPCSIRAPPAGNGPRWPPTSTPRRASAMRGRPATRRRPRRSSLTADKLQPRASRSSTP